MLYFRSEASKFRIFRDIQVCEALDQALDPEVQPFVLQVFNCLTLYAPRMRYVLKQVESMEPEQWEPGSRGPVVTDCVERSWRAAIAESAGIHVSHAWRHCDGIHVSLAWKHCDRQVGGGLENPGHDHNQSDGQDCVLELGKVIDDHDECPESDDDADDRDGGDHAHGHRGRRAHVWRDVDHGSGGVPKLRVTDHGVKWYGFVTTVAAEVVWRWRRTRSSSLKRSPTQWTSLRGWKGWKVTWVDMWRWCGGEKGDGS